MNQRQMFVQLACIWEATARKPGNVHRFADFADVSYIDFLNSAAAIAPILGSADELPLGKTILHAVQATRNVTRTNTNLGIILLLAPLCAVDGDPPDWEKLPSLLDGMTVADSRAVYEAIRLANPGGLQNATKQDIASEPTLPFRQIMSLAAERDMIARQYSNGFHEVLNFGTTSLISGLKHFGALEDAIVHCQLKFLAQFPDSLIARKCGGEMAAAVMNRAQGLFAGRWHNDPNRRQRIDALDRWLREDGNSRNPGTTADLVAASLFVALREGKITLPLNIPWSRGGHHEATI